jgi:hypothetical protein
VREASCHLTNRAGLLNQMCIYALIKEKVIFTERRENGRAYCSPDLCVELLECYKISIYSTLKNSRRCNVQQKCSNSDDLN